MKVHLAAGGFGLILAAWGICAAPARAAIPAPQADEHQPYLDELHSIFRTIEDNYGPLTLKKKTIGLDWTATKDEVTGRVQAAKNDRDYYFAVSSMFNSFNDAHVSMQLPSTYAVSLPFQLTYVEDRFIVNYLDETKLSAQGCELSLGDELVLIDGQTPLSLQQTDPYFHKFGNDLTNRAMFARLITHRSEAGGLQLSDKLPPTTKMTFLRGNTTVECTLKFKVSGLPLLGRELEPANPTSGSPAQLADNGGPFNSLMPQGTTPLPTFGLDKTFDPNSPEMQILTVIDHLVNFRTSLPLVADKAGILDGEDDSQDKTKGTKIEIGHTQPLFQLPADFTPITPILGKFVGSLLMNDIFAGTFTYQGKTVGYLRLADYEPMTALQLLPYLTANLRRIIGQLQERSDYLIIDQTDNPGGAVVYSDMLVEALVGKLDPRKHLRFAVKPTQDFLTQYETIISVLQKSKTQSTDEGTKAKESADDKAIDALIAPLQGDYDRIHAAFSDFSDLSDPISLADMSNVLIYEMNSLMSKLPTSVLDLLFGKEVGKPQYYTKPVYMLTNELDYSAGDATPATLQDYGRVKIVGIHTAGAGGSVGAFSTRVVSKLDWHMTESLMVRKDGSFVENVGVTPDIPFSLTIQDYKDGFKDTLLRLVDTIGNGTK